MICTLVRFAQGVLAPANAIHFTIERPFVFCTPVRLEFCTLVFAHSIDIHTVNFAHKQLKKSWQPHDPPHIFTIMIFTNWLGVKSHTSIFHTQFTSKSLNRWHCSTIVPLVLHLNTMPPKKSFNYLNRVHIKGLTQ